MSNERLVVSGCQCLHPIEKIEKAVKSDTRRGEMCNFNFVVNSLCKGRIFTLPPGLSADKRKVMKEKTAQ